MGSRFIIAILTILISGLKLVINMLTIGISQEVYKSYDDYTNTTHLEFGGEYVWCNISTTLTTIREGAVEIGLYSPPLN